jgi:hypothetical protein
MSDTPEIIYLIENAEQAGDNQSFENGTAARAELAALQSENARWKHAVEGLTPGGSEFVDDPEACAKFIKERTKYPRQIIDLRLERDALKRALLLIREKRDDLWIHNIVDAVTK